jgi:septum formation protein
VVENALRKARAVARDPRAAGATVLGSDTLVHAGEPFGKPASPAEARAMLARLAGTSHEVHSGIALVEPDGAERSGAGRTAVRFRELADAELDWYVATGEWRGRAGGYAIQGRGAALVEGIEGDYSTVVGLPVPALIRLAPELMLR